MRRRLSLTTRKELIEAVRKRYQEATLARKTGILDELVEVTGYHRKHAIRILGPNVGPKQQNKPRSKGRIYDKAVQEALILLWEAADRICGKRLKALVPLLVESMEKYGHLQLNTGVKNLLLQMSAATMERLLAEPRERITGTPPQRSRRDSVATKHSGSYVWGLERSGSRVQGSRSGRALRWIDGG